LRYIAEPSIVFCAILRHLLIFGRPVERQLFVIADGTMARQNWVRHDWIFILFAPIAAVPLFGICLINQDRYLDPWFYTAYARMLKPMIDVNGWTYFSIRFPVIGMISLFSHLFGDLTGYIVLRYVIFVLVAISLYNLFFKAFSHPAAIAAVATLLASPLFARIILWDLPPFMAIPTALSGICIWLTPTTHQRLFRAVAGFLFAAAVNSHGFVATTIVCFMLVEFLMDWRASRLSRFAADLVWATFGGIACTAAGIIYYSLVVGPVGLWTFINPMLGAVNIGLAYHSQAQEAASAILRREFPTYLPFVLTAMNGIVLGKNVLSAAIPARIFWFSAIYCAFFLFFHIVAGQNLFGFFFYGSFLFPTVVLQTPVILYTLSRSSRPGFNWAIAAIFTVSLAGIALIHHFVPATLNPLLGSLENTVFGAAVITVLAICLLASGIVVRFATMVIAPLAAALLALLLEIAPLAHSEYRQVFSSKTFRREAAVYLAAIDLIRLVRAYDARSHRIRLWYPRGEVSMYSLSAVLSMSTLQPPHGVYDTGLPVIGERERKVLADADSAYVLLIAGTDEMIEAGLNALQAAGIAFEQKIQTELGADPTFRIKASLVLLQR
jgi:hypothetical protein